MHNGQVSIRVLIIAEHSAIPLILWYLSCFGLRDKTMIGKVWKVFKEVSIGVLLVISLLLVISGALKTAGIIEKPGFFIVIGVLLKKIQYGSLSDWISSLSTFFTLVVAYLAYKNAPKWLTQKMDDHALEIAKELITKTYPSLSIKFREISIPIGAFYTCSALIDTDEAYKDISKNLINLNEKISKIEEIGFNSKIQIDSLIKLGWDFKDNHFNDIKALQASINNYLSYLKAFNEQMIKVREVTKEPGFFVSNIEESTAEKEKLRKISKSNEKFSNEFMTCFDGFFNNHLIVPEYFDIKSLKVK